MIYVPLPRRLIHRLAIHLRPLSIGVRGIVETREGAVLLVRHTYVGGWHFPGGGLKTGETGEQGVARELREEAAIRLTGAPELFAVYHNRRFSVRDHVLLFRCCNWAQDRPFRPNAEIAEARFFPLDDLPQDLSSGTAARIGEVFGGNPPAGEW